MSSLDPSASPAPAAPFPRTSAPAPTVHVTPWPSEAPLFLLVCLVALSLWAVIAISIVGLVYAVMLGAFFFVAHLTLITYVRGSAVRLSPQQFPELHARVETLAQRAGLSRAPEAYVMQADGSLNAFATRFLRTHLIVLYTDLLDACEGDDSARDMIIGHELGHVRAGHLRWHWVLIPGMIVPFLGAAYSRARELTCDRYGAALCGDTAGAVRGLALLAVGRRLAPRMDLQAYIAQQSQLTSGLMTIGRWLSTYPPLSTRIAALQPSPAVVTGGAGSAVRALAILAAMAIVPVSLGAAAVAAVMWPVIKAAREASAPGGVERTRVPSDPIKDAQVALHHGQLEGLIRDEVKAGRPAPTDWEALASVWKTRLPEAPLPVDPYNPGEAYGVLSIGDSEVLIYSTGPDGESGTDDDIDHRVEITT